MRLICKIEENDRRGISNHDNLNLYPSPRSDGGGICGLSELIILKEEVQQMPTVGSSNPSMTLESELEVNLAAVMKGVTTWIAPHCHDLISPFYYFPLFSILISSF